MAATTISEKPNAKAGNRQDFWLLYPSTNSAKTLSDTMHALYYLPENYKLLILKDGKAVKEMKLMGHDELMARVKLEDETGLSGETSPFSYAHALISDDETPDIIKKTIRSQVIVSTGAKSDLEPAELNSFKVLAGNPPALASAVLRIAHTV